MIASHFPIVSPALTEQAKRSLVEAGEARAPEFNGIDFKEKNPLVVHGEIQFGKTSSIMGLSIRLLGLGITPLILVPNYLDQSEQMVERFRNLQIDEHLSAYKELTRFDTKGKATKLRTGRINVALNNITQLRKVLESMRLHAPGIVWVLIDEADTYCDAYETKGDDEADICNNRNTHLKELIDSCVASGGRPVFITATNLRIFMNNEILAKNVIHIPDSNTELDYFGIDSLDKTVIVPDKYADVMRVGWSERAGDLYTRMFAKEDFEPWVATGGIVPMFAFIKTYVRIDDQENLYNHLVNSGDLPDGAIYVVGVYNSEVSQFSQFCNGNSSFQKKVREVGIFKLIMVMY
jgi:hypothetical protein